MATTRKSRAYRTVVHAVIAALGTTPLAAQTLQCDDPLLQVTGDDPALLARTCEVAARTRDTLASCNVALTEPLDLHLKDTIDGGLGTCLGVYHCGSDQLDIPTPTAMSAVRERDGPFSTIPDEAFWESVIAHEMTHAVYDTVRCPFTDCVVTSEYASYAMQVWSMADADRQLFGLSSEPMPQPSRDAFSIPMLYLAPDRFAALAWAHFETRDEPCTYMGYIMDGKLFFDREPI